MRAPKITKLPPWRSCHFNLGMKKAILLVCRLGMWCFYSREVRGSSDWWLDNVGFTACKCSLNGPISRYQLNALLIWTITGTGIYTYVLLNFQIEVPSQPRYLLSLLASTWVEFQGTFGPNVLNSLTFQTSHIAHLPNFFPSFLLSFILPIPIHG